MTAYIYRAGDTELCVKVERVDAMTLEGMVKLWRSVDDDNVMLVAVAPIDATVVLSDVEPEAD